MWWTQGQWHYSFGPPRGVCSLVLFVPLFLRQVALRDSDIERVAAQVPPRSIRSPYCAASS